MQPVRSLISLGLMLAAALWPSTGAAEPVPGPGIRNVIFDLGGVLVDLNTAELRRRMKPIAGSLENPALQVLIKRFERGQLDLAGYRAALRKLSGKPGLTDRQLDLAWGSQIGRVACRKLKLIERLRRRGFRTYLLSTTDPLHIGLVRRRLRRCLPKVRGDVLAHLFDKAYLTYELGLLKPDVRIYRKVLADAGLKGSETLFIDDSLHNVLGAQRAGLLSLVIRDDSYLRWLPRLLLPGRR